MLKPQQAFDLGIADAIFPSANFLEDSLRWADGVLAGTAKVERPNEPGQARARSSSGTIAIGIAREACSSRKIGTVPQAPYARSTC